MQQLFDKIKSFFAKEEVEIVLPKHTVPFTEIERWIEERFQQKAKSVSETAQPILDKIDDTLFALDANLTNLEHAQLRNKNISSRELDIMKGNKNSYILRSKQFHTHLSSLLSKERNEYADMKAFTSFYFREIEGYHATTLKPYAVLQHFFANEAYAVAKNIKDLDEAIKNLQQLLSKQSTEAITDIKKQIDVIKQRIKQKEELLAEQKNAEEEYTHFKELEMQAEERRKKIEESTSYHQYLSLIAEKDAALKKTEAHVALLRQHISVIDKAIRKFMKLQQEKEAFLQSYLDNPFAVLQQDTAFTIVPLLSAVKEQLLSDTLEIKDDKKEKIADELSILTEDYLRSFLAQHAVLLQQQKELEKRCSSDFTKQQLDEALYMYKTYKEKAAAYFQQKEKCVADIAALAIPDTIAQLQQDIEICTKHELEIVL